MDGLLLVGKGKGKDKGAPPDLGDEDEGEELDSDVSEEELAAAGSVARALGVKADPAKLARALKAFSDACASSYDEGDEEF